MQHEGGSSCCTILTRSRVAIARISAHETTPGQIFSNAVLAWVTASNASPANERLMGASLSAWFPGVDARSTDASQPCQKPKTKIQVKDSETGADHEFT